MSLRTSCSLSQCCCFHQRLFYFIGSLSQRVFTFSQLKEAEDTIAELEDATQEHDGGRDAAAVADLSAKVAALEQQLSAAQADARSAREEADSERTSGRGTDDKTAMEAFPAATSGTVTTCTATATLSFSLGAGSPCLNQLLFFC